jgi:hypothetical protein
MKTWKYRQKPAVSPTTVAQNQRACEVNGLPPPRLDFRPLDADALVEALDGVGRAPRVLHLVGYLCYD